MPIRDATEADLPVIVRIYNAAVPTRLATADIDIVSVASRKAWFDEHTPTSRPLWVIELEGKIAGWLSFQSFYGRPAYHATVEISIYISPDYQRQGIGEQLLSCAIAGSPNLGIRTLIGFIFAHNKASLQLFYKLGFTDWGYLPRVAELDGIERDLVIVGYRINS